MTTTFIVSIILGSSLLSAILTSIVNWYLQKSNYRNEYYKKLLDKRLKAYEEVEFFIAKLKPVIHLGGSNICNAFFCKGINEFNEFRISITPAIISSFWLNHDLSLKLTEFNVFILNDIFYQIDKSKNDNKELIRLGLSNRNKILQYRKDLEELLYKDFDNLHKVKSFIKSKKPDKTFEVSDQEIELQKQ